MSIAIIGLGTNLGDKLQNLANARSYLGAFLSIKKVSSVHETDPWGFTKQPNFLNQVVIGGTVLTPHELLRCIKELETQLGRETTFRYGPRLIDMDILFFDDIILESPGLIVPHPRLHHREFVLAPLAEIAPEWVHPLLQKNTLELLIDLQSMSEG